MARLVLTNLAVLKGEVPPVTLAYATGGNPEFCKVFYPALPPFVRLTKGVPPGVGDLGDWFGGEEVGEEASQVAQGCWTRRAGPYLQLHSPNPPSSDSPELRCESIPDVLGTL
jgi:hypothetical protein